MSKYKTSQRSAYDTFLEEISAESLQLFEKLYGKKHLNDCLEKNQQQGIMYLVTSNDQITLVKKHEDMHTFIKRGHVA